MCDIDRPISEIALVGKVCLKSDGFTPNKPKVKHIDCGMAVINAEQNIWKVL